MNRKSNGFTIVELLIVIVVIGILAAITIVAYNGVQEKARNAQVITGVQAYNKVLLQYAASNGTYPSETGCLGANYPEDQCWKGISGNHTVSNALDTKLSEFIGTKPTLATQRLSISIGDNMRAGALYRPQSGEFRIIYYLQGAATKCIDGTNGAAEGAMKQCTILLPAV